jgi:hypothetical protein
VPSCGRQRNTTGFPVRHAMLLAYDASHQVAGFGQSG